jgi:hypothetical protein
MNNYTELIEKGRLNIQKVALLKADFTEKHKWREAQEKSFYFTLMLCVIIIL